jgi:hypothetical protein
MVGDPAEGRHQAARSNSRFACSSTAILAGPTGSARLSLAASLEQGLDDRPRVRRRDHGHDLELDQIAPERDPLLQDASSNSMI